jgi:hypothetical protein
MGILALSTILFCFMSAAFADQDPGWPRELKKEGATLVYFQPQIDSWKSHRDLMARVAFTLTPPGGKAVPGVASLKAKTMVDKEAGTAVLKDIEMTDARFPSLDEAKSKEMEKLLGKVLSFKAMTMSLDRLVALAEEGEESAQPVAVKTDPPTIFTSQTPAILLSLDGDPALAPIEGTKLQFVINTNWDVFFDTVNKKYYLLNDSVWLTTDALSGAWTVSSTLPADMSKLPTNQNWDDVKKNVPPRYKTSKPPHVFFSSTPAELLVFKGKPVYAVIPGTRLGYATNTASDLFVQNDEQQFYFLISGRWFRAKSLDGPWSYAGNDLPGDFARIPAGSPKSYVLASVPGTQEASDAVLLAEIPTTAVVNRAEAEAKVKIVYDGDPQFKPIEGTTLQYATNTQDKIIKVGDVYYLCFQAVWFMSTSPNGPWKTADSVPDVIYTIPPSSSVYNVTYVYVTNPTPTTVECSHTSGYVGVFVIGAAVGATIAYGTGYYYPPYIYYPPRYAYPIYRPYPYTYGVHAVYNPYNGGYHVGHYAYGPYAAAGGSAWYNPSTGRYGRSATVQTPYGGRSAASTYNPWTGGYAATRQGSNPYGQWGTSVATKGDDWARTAHVTTDQGTRAAFQTSNGESGTVKHKSGGGTVVRTDDNVYAGKDGNVYKKDSSGSWNTYENGGWNSVDTSAAKENASNARNSISPDTLSGLNRESMARQRGSQQTATRQRSASTTRTRRRN